MSAVPKALRNGLIALVVLAGSGSGLYYKMHPGDSVSDALLDDPYIQAVADDKTVSNAVKIAMVMGYYYESGNRHIGKPYIDKMATSRPWTVCNGITNAVLPPGQQIDPNHFYSEQECYEMERRTYLQTERQVANLLKLWPDYGEYQRAVFIDFGHNKGVGAMRGSTMRRLANAGNLQAACEENPRWKFAGSVVWPGLETRGNANEEICESW